MLVDSDDLDYEPSGFPTEVDHGDAVPSIDFTPYLVAPDPAARLHDASNMDVFRAIDFVLLEKEQPQVAHTSGFSTSQLISSTDPNSDCGGNTEFTWPGSHLCTCIACLEKTVPSTADILQNTHESNSHVRLSSVSAISEKEDVLDEYDMMCSLSMEEFINFESSSSGTPFDLTINNADPSSNFYNDVRRHERSRARARLQCPSDSRRRCLYFTERRSERPCWITSTLRADC